MPKMRNVRTARTLISMSAATLAIASSCVQTTQQPYEKDLAKTQPPARHAVHDQRLRQLMAGLGDMALERMPQELERGAATRAKSRDMARIAESLSKTALQIPRVLEHVRMGPEDRRIFDDLAARLSDEAADFARLARRNEVPAMRTKLDEMLDTCNTCHKSFRILPMMGTPAG